MSDLANMAMSLIPGVRQAAARILELEAEVARLQRLNEGLAERVFKQSELLSKRAEKPGIICDECDTEYHPLTDAYKCPACGTENYPDEKAGP